MITKWNGAFYYTNMEFKYSESVKSWTAIVITHIHSRTPQTNHIRNIGPHSECVSSVKLRDFKTKTINKRLLFVQHSKFHLKNFCSALSVYSAQLHTRANGAKLKLIIRTSHSPNDSKWFDECVWITMQYTIFIRKKNTKNAFNKNMSKNINSVFILFYFAFEFAHMLSTISHKLITF